MGGRKVLVHCFCCNLCCNFIVLRSIFAFVHLSSCLHAYASRYVSQQTEGLQAEVERLKAILRKGAGSPVTSEASNISRGLWQTVPTFFFLALGLPRRFALSFAHVYFWHWVLHKCMPGIEGGSPITLHFSISLISSKLFVEWHRGHQQRPHA